MNSPKAKWFAHRLIYCIPVVVAAGMPLWLIFFQFSKLSDSIGSVAEMQSVESCVCTKFGIVPNRKSLDSVYIVCFVIKEVFSGALLS